MLCLTANFLYLPTGNNSPPCLMGKIQHLPNIYHIYFTTCSMYSM